MLAKKGISPLIATVLIVGITVALTGMVIIWGRGFIQQSTEEQGELAKAQLDCLDLQFTVTKACISNPDPFEVTLTLQNIKNIKIDSFTLRSTNLAEPVKITTELKALGATEIIQELDRKVDEIDIVPLLKTAGEYLPCSTQTKTVRIEGTCPA